MNPVSARHSIKRHSNIPVHDASASSTRAKTDSVLCQNPMHPVLSAYLVAIVLNAILSGPAATRNDNGYCSAVIPSDGERLGARRRNRISPVEVCNRHGLEKMSKPSANQQTDYRFAARCPRRMRQRPGKIAQTINAWLRNQQARPKPVVIAHCQCIMLNASVWYLDQDW